LGGPPMLGEDEGHRRQIEGLFYGTKEDMRRRQKFPDQEFSLEK